MQRFRNCFEGKCSVPPELLLCCISLGFPRENKKNIESSVQNARLGLRILRSSGTVGTSVGAQARSTVECKN